MRNVIFTTKQEDMFLATLKFLQLYIWMQNCKNVQVKRHEDILQAFVIVE